jgi:hypothetical protein
MDSLFGGVDNSDVFDVGKTKPRRFLTPSHPDHHGGQTEGGK